MEMAVAVVRRQGIDGLRRGHPWIYESSVARISTDDAAIVRIVGEDGHVEGCGIHDPGSPIRIRVWSTGETARLDESVFRNRLARAIDLRREIFADGHTNAYRLLNGEGDRTPGFVIDRYADVAVLRIDGDAARALAYDLTPGLEPLLRDIGVTTLLRRSGGRGGEGPRVDVLFGPDRARVEAQEHGVPFVVDVVRGQKTGAFLDQRENRVRLGALVRRRARAGLGTRVLNLFSYTGGFSLHAALAGAIVTSVDVATSAHATAQESFRLAGLDPKRHLFVAADAFAWLEGAKKKGESWDVVVSDPPSFAPSERAKPRALAAYRSLHRACAAVLAERGHFLAASCSSHVSAEDFLATLDDATLGRADANAMRLQELHGPPADHPSLPSFPEGRYLKLAILS